MSLPLPGFVYFDENFTFHDGSKGRKLFVILCDSPLSDDNVIIVRTTSSPKSELVFGCYLDTYPPCFHLPNNVNNFDNETWIMLDYALEYEKSGLERMGRITDLSFDHTLALLNCCSNSQYFDKWQIDAISAELENLSK